MMEPFGQLISGPDPYVIGRGSVPVYPSGIMCLVVPESSAPYLFWDLVASVGVTGR